MAAAVPTLPLGLDPLITEAKERARRRRIGVVLLACLFVLAVAAVSLVATRPGANGRTVHVAGISAHVPPGWFVTTRPLNGITDPAQRFVVSSFRIGASDFRRGNDQVFRPPATGVLVQVDEQLLPGNSGFAPRPAHLRLGRFSPMETFSGRRWAELTFRLRGRDFYAFVWIGRDATTALRRQVLSILEGMEVK
jgi:hypothetical protein